MMTFLDMSNVMIYLLHWLLLDLRHMRQFHIQNIMSMKYEVHSPLNSFGYWTLNKYYYYYYNPYVAHQTMSHIIDLEECLNVIW